MPADRPTRVLMLAPQPFFTPRGTPFSVYYRALVMAEQGMQIDLLVYPEGADVAIEGVRPIRIPRVPGMGPVPVGPSAKKLVLDVVMVLWTIGLLLRRRYDVVHAHEEAVFWARFLRPIFRFRLIYDMHSSLPQQLVNFRFTRSRVLIGAFKWLEDSCLRAADAVITICPDLRDYALAAGVPPDRHLLIENSVIEAVRLARRPGVDGAGAGAGAPTVPDFSRPTILYAGTFEAYQGVDLLVRAFARLAPRRRDCALVIAGGTPEQVESIRALARELDVSDRVVLTGRVGKSEASLYTRQATVLVSPRLHGTNTPLKIYEQLASGRPLVATRIWSHTQVLTDEVCVLVEPTPDDLARGLEQVLADPAAAAALAQRAKALYEREYARPVYEAKIRRLRALVS